MTHCPYCNRPLPHTDAEARVCPGGADLAPLAEDQDPTLGGFAITYDRESAETRAVPGMDRTLTYYLSGPMKGYPEHNWPAFEAACEILRYTGLKILSPHEVNPAANEEAKKNPDAYPLHYLHMDLIQMVTKAQGLILMKGWPKSRGAKAELSIALDLEWPVYYYHDYKLVSFQ